MARDKTGDVVGHDRKAERPHTAPGIDFILKKWEITKGIT